MIGIIVKEGESIDSALKRFKKEIINAGIQSEIKKREFYEKPSEIRKKKREAAIRKRRKKMMLMLRKENQKN
ncbi:MAG: 30S ribosomal protein S21 [Leptonema sp. (in: bacteria)]